MPSMILPLMTGLILFFSGIVIGYLFTYRDRSDEEALQEKQNEENERLKLELAENKSVAIDLQNQMQDRDGKLMLLQQICDDFDTEKNAHQKQCQQLESELSSSKSELNEYRKKFSDESLRRAELDDLLHELKQKHVKDLSEVNGQWREKLTRVESALTQRESEAGHLTLAQERISAQLQRAESKIAKLESEIATNKSLLETATMNANGLEKEYITLESSMRAHSELLNESRGQTATVASAKQLAEDALNDLRLQFEEQRARLNKAEEALSMAESTKHRCIALEQSLENSSHRIEQVIAERDAAMSAEKQALTVIGGIRKRNENQEHTIRSLRQDLAAKSTEQLRFQDQVQHLRMAVEQTRQVHLLSVEEHAATQQKLALAENRIQELTDEIDASASVSDQFQSRLDHLVKQRDQAFAECQSLRESVQRATVNARSNEETIRNLRRERGAILMRSRQIQENFPRIMSASTVKLNSTGELAGQTRVDPVRGIVFTEAPDAKDDLKRISGIADVLEKRLNEFGIYTYQQIMEWNQTAIDEFSVLLAFKDRIRRDDWKGQATLLHNEKTAKLQSQSLDAA